MSLRQVRKLPDRHICTQEGEKRVVVQFGQKVGGASACPAVAVILASRKPNESPDPRLAGSLAPPNCTTTKKNAVDSLLSLGTNSRLLFRLATIAVLSAHAAAAAPHLFRVDNPAAAESLTSQGGRLVENYGSFQIIESDQAPAVHTGKAGVQCVDQFNFIQLNARSLNTRAPEASSLRKTVGTFQGRRMHLVHFNGPVKPEWHKALEQTGARIVNYLPHNAYLVYSDAAGLARLQAWANAKAAVQWEGPYLDDFKIHPRARSLDENGNPRAIGTDTFAIQLVADDEANAATLARIDQWKLRPVRRNIRMLQFRNIVVGLPAERLPDIAAQPDVISIQPYFEPRLRDERQDQIVAGNLAGHLPDRPGYLNWLEGKGFTQEQFKASGFVVDVSDSGIDNGSILPCHFGLYESGIPSLGSRVSYTRLAGTANPGSTLRGCDGHGTLNAHIIAGYDGFGGFPYADSVGYSYGLGVCPFVKVGVSVIFDPGFTDPNFTALQTAAYNLGARISNNSWGSVNWGDYDMEAQTFDALVRDVGASEQDRQMVVVFAAGNDGPDIGTINSPATAKNVITVGASENVRSLTPENLGNSIYGEDGCGTTDSEADNANDIADFSGRGPCTDGRMKPDLVAPGTHVTGGVAQSSPITTNGYGAAIPCFDGSGVSGLRGGGACANPTTTGNPDNFFPLGQQFYTVSSGTSHAAPAVSGACALVRQFFINNSQTPPSPAMTKAYLINSARYLDGAGANDTLWSSSQGMGELDLGSGFDGLPRILRDQQPADTFTASGQTRVFTGFVSDPTRPLRITVAWTDAQGSTTAAKALVNDLDLEVTLDGSTFKGNVFNGAYSTTVGTADSLNNVESVFLPAGHSNNFVVTLTAANIAADGVNNGGSLPEQDFALVIQNATIRPVPLIAMNSYSLMNESCTPTNGAIDPGETVTINLTLRNVGNADSTNLVVTLIETGGIVAASGPQNYGSLLVEGPSVSLPFSFSTSGSCGETNMATFRLQDGSMDLGAVTVSISLGALATIYVQNFDGGTSPALPSGWTTSAAGGQKAWTRSRSAYDTPPYSLFSPDPAGAGVNALVSPQIPLPAEPSQLVFRNKYSLEAGAGGTGYDGGVLEIKIGTGSFIDILDAGGSFVTGGYNSTLARSYSNPLAGRQAWTGDSRGFLTTIVNLPAAASGQAVQLRWRCGTDSATSGSGWYIDSVVLKSYWCCPNQPPQPAFIPSVGSYNGLFHPSNGVPFLSSGAFSATTTAAGTCSGTLQMGATRYSFHGHFDFSGAISNQISVKGRDPLTLLLQMDTLDNSRITGTVNGGSWLAALQANRAVFSATANPAPYAGKYTLIIPGSGDPNDASIPLGDGYGAVTIAASGAVKASGFLADGTPFTLATKVSRDGDWPLYLPLYAGKGQVLGWLSFTTTSSSSAMEGWAAWFKPAIASAKFYREGFDVMVTNVVGSSYNPLLSPITGFTNGVVSVAGGNLATNLADAVMISLKNKVTTSAGSSLTITLNPAQGFFKGTVIPPGAKKAVAFGGAILQDMNAGSGYCLGTNQSGKVSFTP